MSAFFNSDGSFPLQFLIIFVVIFVALAAIVLLFRRFSGRGMALVKSGSRGRQPRLGIVDIYELDRQRQLILLRRDNVEHLLLVGGPNDVIVERNINRGASARLPVDEAAKVEPHQEEATFEPARPPEPPIFQAPTLQNPAYSEPKSPAPEPEVTVAPALVAPRGDTPVEPKPAPRFTKADLIAAKTARRNPPPFNLKADVSDRPRSPETQSDRTEQSVVAAVAPAKVIDVAEAPPAPIEPPATEPVRTEPPVRPQPAAKPARAVEQDPDVPPSLARPMSSRPVDAAILSDMARQLEEALRRPSAAISPSPQAVSPKAPPPPAEPKPSPRPEPVLEPMVADKSGVERSVDPMTAAMSKPTDSEPPQIAVPPKADPLAVKPVRDEPTLDGQEKVEPDVFLPAPPPSPPPAREPADKELAAQEPPPPRRAAPAAQNPFSVEEIEAEFARLLGRPLDKKG